MQRGVYGREGDSLWEAVLVRLDEIHGVSGIKCMACGCIVDGGYGADWVVSDDRAWWEARVKCSVIGAVVAGDDGIGGRGGGRSVGIVGNFSVGRKLGWECCGDVIRDEGKILSGEV